VGDRGRMNGENLMSQLLIILIIATTLLNGCAKHGNEDKPPIDSGGLGLSRRYWERIHGDAKWEDSGQVLFRNGKRSYLVSFWDGNAGLIYVNYTDDSTMTMDGARDESRKLIPADSKLSRTESVDSQNLFDYYSSESLRGSFSQDTWKYGLPGEFQVSYRISNGSIESLVIHVGRPIGSLDELKSKPQ
jgi:hypothetical protein